MKLLLGQSNRSWRKPFQPEGTMWCVGRGLSLRFTLGTATMRPQKYTKYSPGQWPLDEAGVGPLLGLPPPAR